MPNCFVPGCWNTYRGTLCVFVTYHKIPKAFQKEWMAAIGRRQPKIISDEVVCSDHFKKGDFYEYGERRLLKSGVIPSQNLPKCNYVEQEGSLMQENELERTFPDKEPLLRIRPETSSKNLPRPTALLSSYTDTSMHDYIRSSPDKPAYEILLRQCYRVRTNQIRILKSKLENTQRTNTRRKMKIKKLSQIVLRLNKKYIELQKAVI